MPLTQAYEQVTKTREELEAEVDSEALEDSTLFNEDVQYKSWLQEPFTQKFLDKINDAKCELIIRAANNVGNYKTLNELMIMYRTINSIYDYATRKSTTII